MIMMLTLQLLVEHVDIVAPDPHDTLHELLDDLGEVPDVDLLIGNSSLPFSAYQLLLLSRRY